MSLVTNLLSSLQSVSDFLLSDAAVTDLKLVGSVMEQISMAANAAAKFFGMASVGQNSHLTSDKVSIDDLECKCEKMRDDLLEAHGDKAVPVNCKSVAVGAGLDWFSVLAPLVLNLIQTILNNIKKNQTPAPVPAPVVNDHDRDSE